MWCSSQVWIGYTLAKPTKNLVFYMLRGELRVPRSKPSHQRVPRSKPSHQPSHIGNDGAIPGREGRSLYLLLEEGVRHIRDHLNLALD